MAATDTSDYDLLTEHLSYPPVSLLDDIINTVNVLAGRALDSVERLLLSIPPQNLGFHPPLSKDEPSPEDAAKHEIENGTHQLETLLNASIDKNFDIFELYAMRYILTVAPDDRPYMRLAHYEGLDFAAAKTADGTSTESITALRRRVHASLRLQLRLQEERAKNEALLRKLRGALGVPQDGDVKGEPDAAPQQTPFGFLRDRAGLEQSGGTDNPITTTAQFNLSQLQAIRSLSSSLRTILPDLTTAAQTDDDSGPSDASKSWRRDRVGYVESASRRYLENAVGLELGPQGEVRDGEWQGDGRQLSRGEVEGLEKVVAILGRAGKDREGEAGERAGEEGRMDES